ncbi:WXG100-like domain-containing protein, partial [Streptomyces griseus]
MIFILTGEKLMDADEDLAFESRRPYSGLGRKLDRLSSLIDKSIHDIGESMPDDLASSYAKAMGMLIDDGGKNYLRDFSDQLDKIAEGRRKTSMDIMESKWQVIAEIIRLLIEIAIYLAMSFFTGGASASQIMMAKLRSRFFILTTLSHLLQRLHLAPSLTEAFAEAFTTFAVRLAMMNFAPDGRRPDGIDWSDIGKAAAFGAAAGFFTSVFDKFAKDIVRSFDGNFLKGGPDLDFKNPKWRDTPDVDLKPNGPTPHPNPKPGPDLDDLPKDRPDPKPYGNGNGPTPSPGPVPVTFRDGPLSFRNNPELWRNNQILRYNSDRPGALAGHYGLKGTADFLAAGSGEALAEILIKGAFDGDWSTSWTTFVGAGVSSQVESTLSDTALNSGAELRHVIDKLRVQPPPTVSSGDVGASGSGESAGAEDSHGPSRTEGSDGGGSTGGAGRGTPPPLAQQTTGHSDLVGSEPPPYVGDGSTPFSSAPPPYSSPAPPAYTPGPMPVTAAENELWQQVHSGPVEVREQALRDLAALRGGQTPDAAEIEIRDRLQDGLSGIPEVRVVPGDSSPATQVDTDEIRRALGGFDTQVTIDRPATVGFPGPSGGPVEGDPPVGENVPVRGDASADGTVSVDGPGPAPAVQRDGSDADLGDVSGTSRDSSGPDVLEETGGRKADHGLVSPADGTPEQPDAHTAPRPDAVATDRPADPTTGPAADADTSPSDGSATAGTSLGEARGGASDSDLADGSPEGSVRTDPVSGGTEGVPVAPAANAAPGQGGSARPGGAPTTVSPPAAGPSTGPAQGTRTPDATPSADGPGTTTTEGATQTTDEDHSTRTVADDAPRPGSDPSRSSDVDTSRATDLNVTTDSGPSAAPSKPSTVGSFADPVGQGPDSAVTDVRTAPDSSREAGSTTAPSLTIVVSDAEPPGEGTPESATLLDTAGTDRVVVLGPVTTADGTGPVRAAVELTREAPGAPVRVRPLTGPGTAATADGTVFPGADVLRPLADAFGPALRPAPPSSTATPSAPSTTSSATPATTSSDTPPPTGDVPRKSTTTSGPEKPASTVGRDREKPGAARADGVVPTVSSGPGKLAASSRPWTGTASSVLLESDPGDGGGRGTGGNTPGTGGGRGPGRGSATSPPVETATDDLSAATPPPAPPSPAGRVVTRPAARATGDGRSGGEPSITTLDGATVPLAQVRRWVPEAAVRPRPGKAVQTLTVSQDPAEDGTERSAGRRALLGQDTFRGVRTTPPLPGADTVAPATPGRIFTGPPAPLPASGTERGADAFAGHGTSRTVTLGTDDATRPTVKVSGIQLGEVLKSWATDGSQDRPLLLFSCETGRQPNIAGLAVAQHVANRTGRSVYAPTSEVGTAQDEDGNVWPVLTDGADGPGRWRLFTPEPAGADLDALAREAGLHTGPDPADAFARARTLQQVRTLREVLGPDAEQRTENRQALAALAYVDGVRWRAPGTAARYGDGRMTPDLLDRMVTDWHTATDLTNVDPATGPTPGQYRAFLEAAAELRAGATPATTLDALLPPPPPELPPDTLVSRSDALGLSYARSAEIAWSLSNAPLPLPELGLGPEDTAELARRLHRPEPPAPPTPTRPHDVPESGGIPPLPAPPVNSLVVDSYTARHVYGIPEKNFSKFRDVARDRNVVVDVRPTNPSAPKWLDAGAMPKPQDIKAKTVNEVDVLLGADAGNVGLVGYFKPVLPAEGSVPVDAWDGVVSR